MHLIILGSGWYGLSLLLHLIHTTNDNNIQFSIIDQEENFFQNNASRYNQCRLHLGYHYPRSYETRKLCFDSFFQFLEKFPNLSYEIKNNWYLISNNSFIDLKTFEAIYSHENYQFQKIPLNNNPHLQNIDQNIAINVQERGIDPRIVTQYFTQNIKNTNILMNHKIKLVDCINNKVSGINLKTNEPFNIPFDYCYDCSNLQVPINIPSNLKIFHEKTISLLYKRTSYEAQFGALTIMDGPFFSIFPYEPENEIYTVTHVTHTVLSNELNIQSIKENIESDIKFYYPTFLDHFTYHDYFTSPKTKPICNNDSRHLILEDLTDSITRVSCGKITGIFQMIEQIKTPFL